MKTKILHAVIVGIIFSSCSSAYKSAQTPDDLYYSPGKELLTTERTETRTERKKYITEDDYVTADDRLLRMKVTNRRWQSIDDYAYWNDSRYFYNCGCNTNSLNFVWFDGRYYPVRNYYVSPYANPYAVYNIWNNPYYYPQQYVKTVLPSRPSRSLVDTYKNTNYDNKNRTNTWEKGRTIYSSEDTRNVLQKVFSSSSSQSVERPVRTFESNTSSSNTRSSSTTTTSSDAGGRSGGYNSTGTSTSTSRPPRSQQ